MERSKILVVDDEKLVRRMIARVLESEGMSIVEASNGLDAVQMAKAQPFDLIILDIIMEGIDGFQVIHQLRSEGMLTPVFILSGRQADNDKVFALGIGADDFNKETLMTNAYTVVINADMNRELLKTVPHNIVAGNLAEVARFRVKSDAESNSSFLITNEHLKHLHMIDDEVLEIAHKNTENQEYKLQNLYKLTFDMMSDEESREIFEDEYKDDDVYVLTNKINLDGANVIASDRILKEVSEKIDSSFYVLPSSRHELILVPDKFNVDPKYLVQMVREVNLTLKQKDFLSDDIYYYNAKKRTLSIYSDAEKQEKSLSETIDKKHTMKH